MIFAIRLAKMFCPGSCLAYFNCQSEYPETIGPAADVFVRDHNGLYCGVGCAWREALAAMIADSFTDAASCKRNPTVIVGLAKDMPTSAVVSPSAAMNACGSFRMSLRSIHDSTIILISYFSSSVN